MLYNICVIYLTVNISTVYIYMLSFTCQTGK